MDGRANTAVAGSKRQASLERRRAQTAAADATRNRSGRRALKSGGAIGWDPLGAQNAHSGDAPRRRRRTTVDKHSDEQVQQQLSTMSAAELASVSIAEIVKPRSRRRLRRPKTVGNLEDPPIICGLARALKKDISTCYDAIKHARPNLSESNTLPRHPR